MRLALKAVLPMVVALMLAAPAKAHLLYHPKCETVKCVAESQRLNLAHARYVCKHGGGRNKRWNCEAKRWLASEYRQTYSTLHPAPRIPAWLNDSLLCIHHYEGAWNANTGNGFYGGLQMDLSFQATYGGDFLRRWGTADTWPVWAQLQAAARAYQSGRGFYPWPNTARACGLL